MGLRESKKGKVRAAIIENAIALFREHGFEATKVKRIAEAAEVSEATFFNYFPTKDAVLSAWAHAQIAQTLGEAASQPDRGLRSVLRRACSELGERLESDRGFAAKAWSRARVVSGGEAPAVVARIAAAQDAGQLRRDMSAQQLGVILYGAICGSIASWLDRGAPMGSLARELRAAADLVLDGSRRRNERVRASAAAVASTR